MLAEGMVTEFFEHVNDELEFARATAFNFSVEIARQAWHLG